MKFNAALAAISASLALTSCAGGAGTGQRLKLVANPSEVVATELAFARAAREDGQWTAFRKYAADGALIFGRDGAFAARPWLSKQKNPAQSVSWQPVAVWSSCDGTLAVTRQSVTRPDDNTAGSGYTVWRRSAKGDYQWEFDFGWPAVEAEQVPEMISAKVADCASPAAISGNSVSGTGTARRSADGTLVWDFSYTAAGVRNFTVWTAGEGATMIPVIEVSIPPAG